jgi:hypothetical protein
MGKSSNYLGETPRVSLPENFSFQKMGFLKNHFLISTRKTIGSHNTILLRLAGFVKFITDCFEADYCHDNKPPRA